MKRFITHLLKGAGLASLLMAAANATPDLQIVGASFPNPVEPGGTLVIETTVANTGSELAVGTDSGDGYMIDFVLSSDDHVPPGFAPFAENFGEDVLLRGGRISNTHNLAPHSDRLYAETGVLPADTPPGDYQLCLVIDPGDGVVESDESNNTLCQTLTVSALEVPTAVERISWGRLKAIR